MARWEIATTIVVPWVVSLVLASCISNDQGVPWVNNLPITMPTAQSFDSVQSQNTGTADVNTQHLRFTGNNTFSSVDTNNDGLFEVLLVSVEVQTATVGEYTVVGSLNQGDVTIANQPTFESASFTNATFISEGGTHHVDLTFSGEQIFRSGQDGPYQLILVGIGPSNGATEETFSTPAIHRNQYGEIPARLTEVRDNAIDSNTDGYFDAIQVSITIEVRISSDFQLGGNLSQDNTSIVDTTSSLHLDVGTHIVELLFPASAIHRAAKDGPYDGTISLIDSAGHTLQSLVLVTQPYAVSGFRPS